MKKILIPFLLTILILSACDPCTDCGELSYEPTVDLVLINGDSLKTTRDSLAVVDTLIFVVDSLNIVYEAIEDGELGYEDERDQLESYIDSQTDLRLVYENFRSYLVTNRTKLNSIIVLINSGKVLVNEISYSFSEETQVFEDSAALYQLALSFYDERTDCVVNIVGTEYDLRIDYDLENQFDIDHIAQRRAFINDVQSIEFDSIRVECKTSECLDHETVITCYF